jgi:hypothetical protein
VATKKDTVDANPLHAAKSEGGQGQGTIPQAKRLEARKNVSRKSYFRVTKEKQRAEAEY